MSQTGLVFGFALGLLLQRSRLNFSRKLQITETKNQRHSLLILWLIILTQSLVLFTLVASHLVTLPSFPSYSLAAVVLGSLIFGIGMVLAQGCVLDNLVQIGELRLSSLVTLIVFTLTLVEYNLGSFTNNFAALESQTLTADNLIHRLHFPPLLLISFFLLLTVTLVWISLKRRRPNLLNFSQKSEPLQYSSNILFTAILIGALAGLAFEANSLVHSFGGFSIVSPLLSWYGFIKGSGTGIHPSWGMYSILGIILGSLTWVAIHQNFNIKITISELISAIVGGLLMGLGAGLSKGTFMSNGLVYTAMLSVQGWLALIFIILGCWSTSLVILLIKKLR